MGKPLAEAPLTQLSGMDILSGEMPQRLAREAERLGPLFRWQIMMGEGRGRDLVFLVGHEANKLVFNTQREAFSHDLGWTPFIGDMMGQGLLNQDNPAWQRSRKMWNPAFTSAYMETYLPLMQRIIAEHTANWAERGRVDLFEEARQITFHVAATALAGIERPDEVARLQQLFYKLIPRMMLGASQEEYERFEREAEEAHDALDRILLRVIAERRAAPESQARDVLGMIVHARDEQGVGLTDDEVLAHLYILLVAGHETTTILGAWTLYFLATEHAQRQRIEEELQPLLADSSIDSSPLSVEGARKLHALDLFIRETGRLHSPVQNVPRGVVRDVEFAGYTIPAGTDVRLALAGCHRMERYFANADAFDPDRFAQPREEDRKTPYSLVTFGGGPRLCIGVNFANIEVKALAVDVLRRYELTPAEAHTPVDMGFITLALPGGIPVNVKRRG